MKYPFIRLLLLPVIVIGFSSCRTSAPHFNYKELAKASVRLNMDIELKDNQQLYVEVAHWMGVPYRYAGNSKQGIDCSGFTSHIYHKVYRKKLQRSTDDQHNKDCRKISKRNLREGDLVFFTAPGSKKEVTHVGIYLKEDKFAHASTSRGVMISSLTETYYHNHWLSGGRVK